ncbi:Cytosine-specific methyltransferase [Tenacibaculum maritimum]|uniref:DNA (cytosine-5-)-methyltransferase n=1 Tax=Tenacibaculum maritimum TaxID=107401 RepID=UPI0012E4B246|nr:DNA (cytosine-5-)-methyltransferase [Tenacibaculum maritimum]CAA0207891.1 Cytosine-specific methyltransferase [Tenacibaculum maritimum]
MENKSLKFIDLFAGIGGFHVALEKLGHECVFASELSSDLRLLYKENHGIECHGDITKINVSDIPRHDVLCAGFPCQTFSKAGNQKGMKEARGKLFDEILKILSFHKPKYFILENVRNLLTHDSGYTWNYISDKLDELGYFFDKKILSPHYINIPQHRERIFIIGSLKEEDVENVDWVKEETYLNSVDNILFNDVIDSDLELEKVDVLNVWKDFMNELPIENEPYRPLWSMEFGANYPLDVEWEKLKFNDWVKYKGMYGYPLKKCKNLIEVYENLPNYVKTQEGVPPSWKQRYIKNNRNFYKDNKKSISASTLNKIKKFKAESWKKLEWNTPGTERNYVDKLIQFRGSGVRVKKNNYLPSLVTVSTQVPIIGKYMRYIAPKEGAIVQSLPDDIKLPVTKAASFRVLGNMVNVELVHRVASELLKDHKISESVLNERFVEANDL